MWRWIFLCLFFFPPTFGLAFFFFFPTPQQLHILCSESCSFSGVLWSKRGTAAVSLGRKAASLHPPALQKSAAVYWLEIRRLFAATRASPSMQAPVVSPVPGMSSFPRSCIAAAALGAVCWPCLGDSPCCCLGVVPCAAVPLGLPSALLLLQGLGFSSPCCSVAQHGACLMCRALCSPGSTLAPGCTSQPGSPPSSSFQDFQLPQGSSFRGLNSIPTWGLACREDIDCSSSSNPSLYLAGTRHQRWCPASSSKQCQAPSSISVI